MSSHYPTVKGIAFKGDVRVTDACLDPCMVLLLQVAVRTAPPLGDDILVVTSANEGQHSAGSLHYVGRAFDIRFTLQRIGGIVVPGDVPADGFTQYQAHAANQWAGRMRQQLPEGYDIIVEGNHLHVERDSKHGR